MAISRLPLGSDDYVRYLRVNRSNHMKATPCAICIALIAYPSKSKHNSDRSLRILWTCPIRRLTFVVRVDGLQLGPAGNCRTDAVAAAGKATHRGSQKVRLGERLSIGQKGFRALLSRRLDLLVKPLPLILDSCASLSQGIFGLLWNLDLLAAQPRALVEDKASPYQGTDLSIPKSVFSSASIHERQSGMLSMLGGVGAEVLLDQLYSHMLMTSPSPNSSDNVQLSCRLMWRIFYSVEVAITHRSERLKVLESAVLGFSIIATEIPVIVARPMDPGDLKGAFGVRCILIGRRHDAR